MQSHPQLLRRPLPPSLPKLSLCKKKPRAVKAAETKPPRARFVQDKTILTEREKTRFPDVVSGNQSQPPVNIQNLHLDHHVRERVTTLSTLKKTSKNVYWHIPETATGSIFFPMCPSASSRVFGKQISKIESSRKPEEPSKIKNTYADNIFKDIMIVSSEFPRRPSAPSSTPTPKLKEVHAEHLLLCKSTTYSFKQPLLRLSAAIPVPRTTPVKAERQWFHCLQQKQAATLTISDFPGPVFIPLPILPRKPLRQSVIETCVTQHERKESIPKQSMLSLPEGIKSKKIETSVTHTIQGEGFKTVVATRYETITAMTNLATVNCQIYGRNALNLKGFFLLYCPDLTPLASQLVYLNLSYNNIFYFPTEIFCLRNLQILILRNNPIKEIPSHIQQLKFLRTFNIAFNLITTLPLGLFYLFNLEKLDISYNSIAFIPNEIQKLRSLKKLIVDGNELTTFPPGILKLTLRKILFENNFTHPTLWKENSVNSPQRLTQLTSLFFLKNNLHMYYTEIPEKIQKLLKCMSRCEWCHGPKFGEGFRIIRSYNIFGATQLPVLYHVCSSSCYRKVKESSVVSASVSGKEHL